MPATVPPFGWRVPEGADPPEGPQAFLELATDISATVARGAPFALASLERADVAIANDADVALAGGWTALPGSDYAGVFSYAAGVLTVLRDSLTMHTVYVGWASAAGGFRRTDYAAGATVAFRAQDLSPGAVGVHGQTVSVLRWTPAGTQCRVTVRQNSGGPLNVFRTEWSIAALHVLPAGASVPVALPESTWLKADIVGWLLANGVALDADALAHLTKTELLALVADLLDAETD